MEFSEFKQSLPETLGDSYWKDPETKQEPTKAFDDINDYTSLAKSFLETKRMVGKKDAEYAEKMKGLTKIPGEGATVDEIAAYRRAIGVPEAPEGYELAISKDLPEDDRKGFEAVANAIKPIAHEVGIPPSKLATVWNKVTEVLSAQNAELTKKAQELMDADIASLKEAKKEKYDEFMKSGDETIVKMGEVGQNFKKLMDAYGILDTPAVREVLFEISKHYIPSGSHLSGGKDTVDKNDGFTYAYDEHGRPIR